MKKLKCMMFFSLTFVLSSCSPTFEVNTGNDSKILKVVKIIREKLNSPSAAKIEPLKGGLSGTSLYRISMDGHDFVVRLINHRSLEDRQREIDAQNKAGESGYGPQIYYADVEEGIIVMAFLENQPLTDKIRGSLSFYQSLGSLVKTIHSGPSLLEGEPTFDHIRKNIEKIKWDEHSQINKDTIKYLSNKIQRVMEKHSESVPTHRDLNPNNIIFSHGKAFAIDYENASQDNPYVDLGTIGIFYLFDEESTTTFLTSYFGHAPTRLEKSKLFLMKQVSLIYYGTELLTKMPPHQTITSLKIPALKDVYIKINKKELDLEAPHGKWMLALSMLKEALNNSQTAQFDKALKYVKSQ